MDEFAVGEAVAEGWVDNGSERVQKVGVATEEEDVRSDGDGGVRRREKKLWFEAVEAEDNGLLRGGGGGGKIRRERERYLSGGRIEATRERDEDESVNAQNWAGSLKQGIRVQLLLAPRLSTWFDEVNIVSTKA